MKELLFYNKPGHKHSSSHVLILKLGLKHAGYAITEPSGSELYSFAYCSINELNEDCLDEFQAKYKLLEQSYKETMIIFDIPTCHITPYHEPVSKEDVNLLHAIHGYTGEEALLTDKLPAWQLNNSYMIDEDVWKWIAQVSSGKSRQQYSVAIMNLTSTPDEGKLLVDFRHDEFSVVAARKSKFLFAQTYEYEAPADVLYYLLKICEEFSFSPKEVVVKLSGLIEKDSALYKELYLYFINLEFNDASWGTVNDYPAHFFTSFNDILQCEL